MVNSHEHTVESYVPTSFLQMWFRERFLACRLGTQDLASHMRGIAAVTLSGRLPLTPSRYPRTALYENVHIKKASQKLHLIMDKLKSFVARPYEDVSGEPLFLNPTTVFLDDELDSINPQLGDEEWDFVSMVTPGFIPGYFNEKFCAVAYNFNRVARQLGYDQGVPSILTPLFLEDESILHD